MHRVTREPRFWAALVVFSFFLNNRCTAASPQARKVGPLTLCNLVGTEVYPSVTTRDSKGRLACLVHHFPFHPPETACPEARKGPRMLEIRAIPERVTLAYTPRIAGAESLEGFPRRPPPPNRPRFPDAQWQKERGEPG